MKNGAEWIEIDKKEWFLYNLFSFFERSRAIELWRFVNAVYLHNFLLTTIHYNILCFTSNNYLWVRCSIILTVSTSYCASYSVSESWTGIILFSEDRQIVCTLNHGNWPSQTQLTFVGPLDALADCKYPISTNKKSYLTVEKLGLARLTEISHNFTSVRFCR